MKELLSATWPWYVAGPLIALVVAMLLLQGRKFGISSSLEAMCSLGGAGKISDYFKVDWKRRDWLLVFVLGSVLGGLISNIWLENPEGLVISDHTINALAENGLAFDANYLPAAIFDFDHLFTGRGFIMMVIGGFLVGFGTRYAGGCTSGHAISGLADFQLPSLVATIGFFIGGLITTHVLLPYILQL